jgi:AraC family transcriptional regulator, transcriptional activator of pobA
MKKTQWTNNNQIPFVELELQKPSPFHIKKVEENVDIEKDQEYSHRHNFNEIFWFRSGSGTQSIDGQRLEISPRTFYMVAQGQVHEFIEGHALDGLIIQFGNDFILEQADNQTWTSQTFLFGCITNESRISIRKSECNDFEFLIKQLQKEYQGRESFGKNQILRHLLNVLLIKLQRNLKEQLDDNSLYSHQHNILQNFLQLLDNDFKKRHQVSEYTEDLSVSARQLTDATKIMLGKTAKEVILERIILEAKRYLHYSGLSIKEIAYDLGFEDPSYFSKQFKLSTSQSPLGFRKTVRQN